MPRERPRRGSCCSSSARQLRPLPLHVVCRAHERRPERPVLRELDPLPPHGADDGSLGRPNAPMAQLAPIACGNLPGGQPVIQPEVRVHRPCAADRKRVLVHAIVIGSLQRAKVHAVLSKVERVERRYRRDPRQVWPQAHLVRIGDARRLDRLVAHLKMAVLPEHLLDKVVRPRILFCDVIEALEGRARAIVWQLRLAAAEPHENAILAHVATRSRQSE